MVILACFALFLLLSLYSPALWAAPMTFPAAAPISAGDIAYREQPVYYSGTQFKRELNAESVGIYGLSHNIAFIFEETPIQYNYTQRKIWSGIGGGPAANDNMLFTSLRYYVP